MARARRQRSITESLLSIVLGLEAFLVFFVTLTAFGLRALPPATAFAGGAVLIVALILAASLLRFPWGVWVGWVLQVVLLATGFILPIMFFIAAGFIAIWIYCFIKARQLSAQGASPSAATGTDPDLSPEPIDPEPIDPEPIDPAPIDPAPIDPDPKETP